MTKANHPEDLVIARLRKNNLGDLATLYNAVYGKQRDVGYFEKKYDTHYTGVVYTGFIAYNKKGLPVSYYGVIPTKLTYKGQVILAAQSTDTMTHPAYRNKGLFTELAEKTFELCKTEGIKLVFGFPNQNSLPGFINKLHWHITDYMDCFVIPVNSFVPWQKIGSKLSILKPVISYYQRQVLKKYLVNKPGVVNSALTDGFDGVLRDEAYLKYKTFSPTRVIKIGTSEIWIKTGDSLQVGDIMVTDFDVTMNKLIKLAGKMGLRDVQFQASPGTSLYTLFAERYKAIPSFPVIFKDLDAGIKTENIKFTFADIDIF